MAFTRTERSNKFDISDMRLRLAEHLHIARPESGRVVSVGHRVGAVPIVIQHRSWQAVALIIGALAVVSATALAGYAFYDVGALKAELAEAGERMEQRLQKLDSRLSEETRRRELLLGMRDEILKTNPRVGLGEAYRYSHLILRASDKYPTVNPLLFLAIGIVESGYDPRAVSRAEARGLYQLWPSTGRMLARILSWEYSDEMLFDPEKNTEMAALYLDILFSAYNEPRMVLAEYNGGPLNAGLLRAGSSYTAAETRQYVDRVLEQYQRLTERFALGGSTGLELMHKDAGRDGKTLGVEGWAQRTSPAGSEGLP